MKRILYIGLTSVVGLMVIFGIIWRNTQPVWPVDSTIETAKLKRLPVTNREVVS